MKYTGEGHYSIYLEQEHTGYDVLGSYTGAAADRITRRRCASLSECFKRCEERTASPSDLASFIFGVYHSPISGTYVTSSIHRLGPERFLLTQTGFEDWTFCVAVRKHAYSFTANERIFFQSALFHQLIDAISFRRVSTRPASNDPVTIHLEVDLCTYRALIMFAEYHGLRFRFLPIPVHQHFDDHKARCEQGHVKKRDDEWPGSVLEGALKDLPVNKLPRKMRYPVIAYCPSCAKLLPPVEKLQCKQCKIAFYCSVECQKKDWENLHREECPKFKRLAEEADREYCRRNDGRTSQKEKEGTDQRHVA